MKNNPYSATVQNGQAIALSAIPVLNYPDFYQQVGLLLEKSNCHCVNYYLYPKNADTLKSICAIADDETGLIELFSYELKGENPELEALTAKFYQMHVFEREIWENWGVIFLNHPWLKPIRFAFDRHNPEMKVNDYPFYKIKTQEMHEVGVGPIHAGVIEPGHFRFLCHGEMVYHLEIQLGWQHRGVESVYLEKKSQLQRHILSECIAGDTAVGHNLTFARATEALLPKINSQSLDAERCIALEWERIAMHIFDLSNLCTGAAYQLGNSVFGALRTPIINFFQSWCGNRFAKSLIRTNGSHYPLTAALREKMWGILQDWEWKFDEIAHHTFNLSSVQNRFDDIGKLTQKQVHLIGAVGVAARMANLSRDIRQSHPTELYKTAAYEPVLEANGDVFARFFMRRLEIKKSISLIRKWLSDNSLWATESPKPLREQQPVFSPSSLSISLTEAWRGEICHCAITNEKGELAHYKVKDPSLHNWTALALSLRNLEISDFPINNKSYNLSYCGHDL